MRDVMFIGVIKYFLKEERRKDVLTSSILSVFVKTIVNKMHSLQRSSAFRRSLINACS